MVLCFGFRSSLSSFRELENGEVEFIEQSVEAFLDQRNGERVDEDLRGVVEFGDDELSLLGLVEVKDELLHGGITGRGQERRRESLEAREHGEQECKRKREKEGVPFDEDAAVDAKTRRRRRHGDGGEEDVKGASETKESGRTKV